MDNAQLKRNQFVGNYCLSILLSCNIVSRCENHWKRIPTLLVICTHVLLDHAVQTVSHTKYWILNTIHNIEGYNTLRQKFGPDSFWVNGPYHAIMTAINGPGGGEGSYFNFNIFNTNPESSTLANMLPTPQTLIQQSSNQQQLLETSQQQLQDSSSFLHSQPALAVLPGQL